MIEMLAYALRWPVLRKSASLSALVGTILSAVNQGDMIVAGPRTPRLWVRVAFNYLVPLLVASASAAANRCEDGRAPKRNEEPDASRSATL